MKSRTFHTTHQDQHGTVTPCSNALAFRGDDGTKRLLDPQTQPLGGDVEIAASAPSAFETLCQRYGWHPDRHPLGEGTTLRIAETQLAVIEQQIQDLFALADASTKRQEILTACRERFAQWAEDAWVLDEGYQMWLENQMALF